MAGRGFACKLLLPVAVIMLPILSDCDAMDSSFLRLLIQPRHWLAGISLGCLYLINLLPYPIKIRIGIGIGRLTYRLIRRRKHIAAVNIKICFPHLDDAARLQMLKRTFDNFGAGLIETAMGWWSDENEIHKLAVYEGLEQLQQAEAKGKGVLLVGAHFSSLDLASKLLSKHYRTHAVYKLQKNKLVNYVLENGRSSSLRSLIDNRDSRKIIRTIRAGEIVWFAPDHDMGERLSVFAPFFEQTAATVTITGRYAKMTGAPAVFFSHHRNATNDGYKIRFKALPEDFSQMDDMAAATLVNQTIAEHILIDPAQYYWFHRRFKTQPSLPQASFY